MLVRMRQLKIEFTHGQHVCERADQLGKVHMFELTKRPIQLMACFDTVDGCLVKIAEWLVSAVDFGLTYASFHQLGL